MSSGSRSTMLRQFRTLFEAGTVAGLTDAQLLERFLSSRDEGGEVAFEALVARHGPMVLGVCRRSLADPNDVADAFQATFLVLVRKARSVRVDDSLGRWLYGVSRRVASRARAVAARRPRTDDGKLDTIEARSADPDHFELAALLDEELARLPSAFRSALILCDLEGLTHEEAARDLRCPVGTIKSRLARGRERLRGRLERRGLAPAIVALLGPRVPSALMENAVKAALLSNGSGTTAVGVVSASVVVLSEGVLKSMSGFTWKLTASAVLTLGVVTSSAVVLGQGQKGDGKSTVEEVQQVAEIEAKLEAKLDQLISLNLKATPLGDVMVLLGRKTGINFVLDPKALNDNGVSPGTPINLSANEIKLKVALKHILGDLRLSYKVVDDVVLITTPPRADRASRGQGMLDLHDELENARKRLINAERLAPNPDDPAIAQARARVSEMEAAVDKIDRLFETVLEDKAGSDRGKPAANKGRKPWPGRGAGGDPPREFSKVSMPDYIVEPPDIIAVEVLEALPGRPITGEHLVRPDGKISLGFYGEIYVAGLTTTEIKAKVALHLREYLLDGNLGLTEVNHLTGKTEPVDPTRTHKIFVEVTAYNSKVYYVQGEVATPGRLVITGNETVLDAINYAGGLKPTAAKDRIRLVRPSTGGNESELTLFIDLPAILNGQTKTNYQLLPGDRLIIDRDPKMALEDAKPSKPESTAPMNFEARLQTVERKLDEIIKALDRLPKP